MRSSTRQGYPVDDVTGCTAQQTVFDAFCALSFRTTATFLLRHVQVNRGCDRVHVVKLNHLKKKTSPSLGRFTPLGDVNVPHSLGKSLQLGSKFCLKPVLRPLELVYLARKVAYKATDTNHPRCFFECMNFLDGLKTPRWQLILLRPLVNYMIDNELCLLVSDKEGSFVVLLEDLFDEKADAAIDKNFKPGDAVMKKVKVRAQELCRSLALSQLGARIKKSEGIWT